MEIIKESMACAAFFACMFVLLVFGSAVIPYQPSMFNEGAFHGQ